MGILTDAMQRLVREQRLAFVATVGADGRPNLSPRGTGAVWDEDHLIFADLASPRTTANLRARPFVEVNVVDPVARKGYRFRGEATVLDHGELFDRAIDFYAGRNIARPRERVRAVVLVRVTETEPVISPGYDLGVSEAETRRWWAAYYSSLWLGTRPPDGPEP